MRPVMTSARGLLAHESTQTADCAAAGRPWLPASVQIASCCVSNRLAQDALDPDSPQLIIQVRCARCGCWAVAACFASSCCRCR